MVDPEDDDLEIDELGKRMLSVLSNLGGESDSRELRDELGDVKHSPFSYRLSTYLEPLGLVDTHQPDAEPGDIPPKEITLTDAGREFLEEMDTTVGMGVESRVDQLEDRVDALYQENQELKENNRELQEALERSNATGLGEELQSLRASINQLETRVHDIEHDPVVGSNVAPGAIDTGLILGNTCKKLLEDVLDEETVEQKRVEMKSDFQEDNILLVD